MVYYTKCYFVIAISYFARYFGIISVNGVRFFIRQELVENMNKRYSSQRKLYRLNKLSVGLLTKQGSPSVIISQHTSTKARDCRTELQAVPVVHKAASCCTFKTPRGWLNNPRCGC